MNHHQQLINNDTDNNDTDNNEQSYHDITIPSWNNLCDIYESRWRKEKERFHRDLKINFNALVERFACGKQEIYQLCTSERLEKKYTRAFLELFESGYAPHVGDVERIAAKRVIKLYITLPNNYAD